MVSKPRPAFIADADHPLIAVPAEIDGRDVILYFTDAAAAAEGISDEDIQAALDAIGSFSDLDWDDFVDEIEHLRQARSAAAQEDVTLTSEPQSIATELHDPLIALVVMEDGREVVRYFASEADVDAYITDEDRQAALNAVGSFSDLDWDDMISELERIRHESDPTPLFEP